MTIGDEAITLELPISADPCEEQFTVTEDAFLQTVNGETALPEFMLFSSQTQTLTINSPE